MPRFSPKFFGESKIDFRELDTDLNPEVESIRRLVEGPGVMLMLMKGVAASSSESAPFLGEYDIGVFSVLGFGAKGTFLLDDAALAVGAGAS
jgi:hypothetical protein